MLPESARRHRSDIVFTLALLLALAFIYIARDILLLIYVSALAAVVIGPALDVVQRLQIGRWRPGRGLAILMVIVALLGTAVLFFAFALPPVFRDLRAFAGDLPHRLNSLQETLGRTPLAGRLDLDSLQHQATTALGGMIGVFRGLFGGIFTFITAAILTAYFALDGEQALHWGLSMIAAPQRERLEQTLLRAELRLRRWLIGQGALMLILGCTATAAFAAIHLRYFYALGMLAGILNIVPIVGPLTSLALAALVALLDSPAKLLGVLVFYFCYQQVETAFLTPRIMRFTVDLPPLGVVVALAVGGSLAGVLGALIAVPTAALISVLAEEYLVRKPAPLPAGASRAPTD